MTSPDGDANSEEHPSGAGPVHLTAHVSGPGAAYQAGRDINLHYGAGVHGARRTDAAPTGECPYPGMAAMGPDRARWFFGRDSVLADLTGRLADRLAAGGPLIVV